MGLIKLIIEFFTGLSPKTWLVILAILSLLGAFFWFKHSIYKECQSDVQAQADAAKIIELNGKLEQYKQIRSSRDKTDAKIKKMSNSDIDDALVSGGWMRD